MLRTQPEGQPCRQCQRRSNHPARGNDNSDIENILLPHSLEHGRARPSESRSSFESLITPTYRRLNQPTLTEFAANRWNDDAVPVASAPASRTKLKSRRMSRPSTAAI